MVEESKRADREVLVLCRFRDFDLFGRPVGGCERACVSVEQEGNIGLFFF